MIPLKLQIKNFLSYGSETQEVDFSPYNLICLSGKNGHGKSALLDAMTWSIWGEARKNSGISKPDQGLLRLGQRQMLVIFDFEFNKNKYRVRREFTNAYGKAYAYLEFGIFENEEKLIPLTDKTIRATQEKIENMIGLNYDSFVNSAFLKQGSSNEFSRKSPKERKEILGNILGLEKYESLRKLALDKIKIYLNEKDTITKICEHIEKELTVFDETKQNLITIETQLEKLLNHENHHLKLKELVESDKTIFLNKKQEEKLLTFQLSKNKEEEREKINQLKNMLSLWKETHKKKILSSNQTALEEKKIRLIKKINNLQNIYENKLNLREKLIKLKEEEQLLLKKNNDDFNFKLHQKKIELERLIINKENLEINLNQKKKARDDYIKEHKKIDNEVNKIRGDFTIIDADSIILIEKQFEKRKASYQKFVAQGNLINTELIDLEQKKKLSFDNQNPSCPLCEQNLSVSRKKFLKLQFSKKEKFYRHRLKRISTIILKLKEVLFAQNDEIKIKKSIIDQNNILKIKFNEINKNQEKLSLQINNLDSECLTTQQEILENQQKIEHLENMITIICDEDKEFTNTNKDYLKTKKILDEINFSLNATNYDQEAHKKAISDLNELELVLSFCSNLDEINKIQKQKQQEISKLILSLKMLKKNIRDLEEKNIQYTDLKNEEIALKNKENELIQAIKEISNKKEELLHKKGSFENQKSKLEQLYIELKNQKKIITQLEESIEEYKIISTSLSKDGIQALLIEDAIPEIEAEANELLSKLTDNQSQIFIESLRDLKKGGTKETLDIKISDSIGIRPYEMFSGGEAFRIDFALRIAISKLLARRAGTSLQTLIIDEGFGSQDEEGLSNIMDSIYKIQDDFSKIIIVSHLPTMKDQFPVHFYVEKSPGGSKVKIIEQG